MRAALDAAQTNESGAEVADAVTMASLHVVDVTGALASAQDALKTAARNMPANTRGRGGALARLRLSPDAALLDKLASIWRVAGLSSRAGDEGDGLDVFIFHALRAADPAKVAKANWFGKLRERVSAELSRENRTPK